MPFLCYDEFRLYHLIVYWQRVIGGYCLKRDFLQQLQLDENHVIECKLAQGGLPVSIWETYSSFANTEGGTIFLGVKENRDSFTIEGLNDRQISKYRKEFFSTLNNRKKVSKNILLNHHVVDVEVEGKKLLRIDVPAADRHDKPIYIGTDPLEGTYRRDYEGDYKCTEDEIRAMFSDQRDQSVDSQVLDEMELDVFHADTIKSYRNLFQQLHEGHPWNALLNDEFLIKLRAAAKNKDGGVSPTIAGLLMFGESYHITEVFSNYFLDYREETDDPEVRWLFRTTSDEGDWSGNLFDFYFKVINRLDDDIAVPFGNRRDGVRVDHVDVHEALGEAVANALVHSNYYGRRGIVIIKHKKKISISNPGTLRITKDEFFAGGNSDPRNPNLLKMFGFINIGERAGSGIDKILSAWKEQKWKDPEFEIILRPVERVTVRLEVGQVVYIPGVVDIVDYHNYKDLKEEAFKRIESYLKVFGYISTKKAIELSGYKSRTSARNLLSDMEEKGLVVREGEGAGTKYVYKHRKE